MGTSERFSVENIRVIMEEVLTLVDVSERLGIQPGSVRNLIARGGFPPADGYLGDKPWWALATLEDHQAGRGHQPKPERSTPVLAVPVATVSPARPADDSVSVPSSHVATVLSQAVPRSGGWDAPTRTPLEKQQAAVDLINATAPAPADRARSRGTDIADDPAEWGEGLTGKDLRLTSRGWPEPADLPDDDPRYDEESGYPPIAWWRQVARGMESRSNLRVALTPAGDWQPTDESGEAQGIAQHLAGHYGGTALDHVPPAPQGPYRPSQTGPVDPAQQQPPRRSGGLL